MEKLTDAKLIDALSERLKRKDAVASDLRDALEQLREVNGKLVESEKVKTQFLSNIRNEINNPLSSIMALSDTLIKSKHLDRETTRSVATTIQEESRELDFQLNNIFVASELEAGEAKPEISKVCVIALVNDVIDSAQARMSHKRVRVELKVERAANEELYFHTDAEKLSVVLMNLIANAIEFSEDDGEVDVVINGAEGELILTVIDQGVGIAEEHQEVIFDRFKQLDTGTTKQHRGHGLGLSITRSVLDALNGGVTVSSSPGEGSEFVVRLPESAFEEGDSEVAFLGNEELFDVDEDMEIF